MLQGYEAIQLAALGRFWDGLKYRLVLSGYSCSARNQSSEFLGAYGTQSCSAVLVIMQIFMYLLCQPQADAFNFL